MKRFVLFVVLQLVVIMSFAQSYIAHTVSGVNLREGPSTEYDIIEHLKKGTALYVDLDESIEGWYLVVDIENDIEGYVSSKYVELDKRVEKSNSTSIQKSARSYGQVLNRSARFQGGSGLIIYT